MAENNIFDLQLDTYLAKFIDPNKDNQQPATESTEEIKAEVEEQEATTAEIQAEETKETDIEENKTEVSEPEQTTDESPEPEQTEEKPEKPKRKRRTKAQIEADRLKEEEAKKAKAEHTDDTENEEEAEENEPEASVATNEAPDTITVTISKNQTYKDIINALDLLPAVDEDFIKIKEEIQNKMNQIVVQSGMDRPNIEIMGQKIDELNAIISARMAAMKTAYENLSSREDGILMRVMAKGSVSGSPYNQSNDAARRANGICAAENFVSPKTKKKVDLYWGVYATRYAKNFYEAAAEQLENKRRLLKQQADFITMHN